jgi:hypothetical protein
VATQECRSERPLQHRISQRPAGAEPSSVGVHRREAQEPGVVGLHQTLVALDFSSREPAADAEPITRPVVLRDEGRELRVLEVLLPLAEGLVVRLQLPG